ncbi:YdeI/OmpD-associated family protein [Diaminobutyricimonas sp. TR449]|uniref:YdeI/OmpD-associated family protein n=1 Tax=Diaminobutyricimonas sp. TR449 TaxID=2708076 RepID=UPI0014210FE2|nr:YdeI/OmpD-associated family protein [Diaminobutyricimonas sp. TR449]
MVNYRNPGVLSFDAVIQRADVSGSSAFVEFPFSVSELFGVKGRVPVTARFDGHPYRGSLVTYGGPHLILVRSDVQRAIGKAAGDSVHVEIELDTAERIVDLDPDETTALTDAGLLDAFRSMPYSHQREYHLWISEAKRAETRESRIEKMLPLVAEKKKLK